MVRILLVEDDLALAKAVTGGLVARSQGAWQVQHEPSISAARAVLNGPTLPQLAIVDLALPDGSGIELIGELSGRASPLRCVAFTVFDDRESVLGALRAGAVGYLLKGDAPERVMDQIGECLDGQFPVSSRVAGYLFELCRPPEPESLLTAREQEVLACLATGVTYAECAERLGISLSTVQTHIKHTYRKLDVSTRAEAVARTSQQGGQREREQRS